MECAECPSDRFFGLTLTQMPQAPKSGVDDMKQTTLTKSCKQALWACWRLSVLIFLGKGCQAFLQGEEKRLSISFTLWGFGRVCWGPWATFHSDSRDLHLEQMLSHLSTSHSTDQELTKNWPRLASRLAKFDASKAPFLPDTSWIIQFYSPCPLLLAAHVILNALSYAWKSCQRTCILTGEVLTEWNILSMFRTFPTWLQANRKMVQGKARIFSGKGLDHRIIGNRM